MIPTILKLTIGNQSKIAAILSRFPMVLDKMAAILIKTEHHCKTEHHWKTEQKATIGILNTFGVPALCFVVISDRRMDE